MHKLSVLYKYKYSILWLLLILLACIYKPLEQKPPKMPPLDVEFWLMFAWWVLVLCLLYLKHSPGVGWNPYSFSFLAFFIPCSYGVIHFTEGSCSPTCFHYLLYALMILSSLLLIKREAVGGELLVLLLSFSLFTLLLMLVAYRELFKSIPHLDKWAHGILFCGLSILMLGECTINGKKRSQAIAHTLCLCLFYGMLTELLQSYIFVYRSGDLYDFLADMLGMLWGILIFLVFRKYISKVLHYLP